MSRLSKKKALFLVGIIFILFTMLAYKHHAFFLSRMALLLRDEQKPEKSDVIVALRGDWYYSRILTAHNLFKKGFGPYIYISTALIDRNSSKLEKLGIEIKSEQERLLIILEQLNVPADRILKGYRKAGGGTIGEIKRIKAMMDEHKFRSALIITDWWHTKRTKKICRCVFGNMYAGIRVVSAEHYTAPINSWWKHRYEAVKIIEEFPKLILYYFFSSNFNFEDDPIN
jgi:uncharacterized SAM-binding protein YcdF (DUF218 family)